MIHCEYLCNDHDVNLLLRLHCHLWTSERIRILSFFDKFNRFPSRVVVGYQQSTGLSCALVVLSERLNWLTVALIYFHPFLLCFMELEIIYFLAYSSEWHPIPAIVTGKICQMLYYAMFMKLGRSSSWSASCRVLRRHQNWQWWQLPQGVGNLSAPATLTECVWRQPLSPWRRLRSRKVGSLL